MSVHESRAMESAKRRNRGKKAAVRKNSGDGSRSSSPASSDDEQDEAVDEPQIATNLDNSEIVHLPNGLTVKYTYEQQYRSEILSGILD